MKTIPADGIGSRSNLSGTRSRRGFYTTIGVYRVIVVKFLARRSAESYPPASLFCCPRYVAYSRSFNGDDNRKSEAAKSASRGQQRGGKRLLRVSRAQTSRGSTRTSCCVSVAGRWTGCSEQLARRYACSCNCRETRLARPSIFITIERRRASTLCRPTRRRLKPTDHLTRRLSYASFFSAQQ